MNNYRFFYIPISLIIFSVGCSKLKKDQIIHHNVNEEHVLIRDVETLQSSNDEISMRVDSILSGDLHEQFVSSGHKWLDIDGDQRYDLAFEIINLNEFNQNNLPESFDSLAARVVARNVDILDNSTYGYADALEEDDKIDDDGHWSSRSFVLGTFANAGNFNGKGEQYLGFRIKGTDDFKYGWVKLYCSEHNDTLKVIDYGYNGTEGKRIFAGQKN